MKINYQNIKVKDIFEGFENNEEGGVFGYGGKLNIRPPYQREFVYKDEQAREVVRTIVKGFPLNIMYWSKNADGTFELLDGQQRTMSICTYLSGNLSVDEKYFNNLTVEERAKIENYEIMVYICEGTEREKLDWFKIVNIAGEKLTEQELRNSVYTGKWLSDAKKKFSGTTPPAMADKYRRYLKTDGDANPIRQGILEKVLKWISRDKIEDYMARHQHNENADELWDYYERVFEWVESVFIDYRKEMRGLPWGEFYNRFQGDGHESRSEEIRKLVNELMADEEVERKSGIYEYILTGDEKSLNLRTFDDNVKRTVYEQQNGVCRICLNRFDISEMDADHIVPWSKGGKTVIENCQMLCRKCNHEKSNRY